MKQVIAETSLQHEYDFEAGKVTWKLRRNLQWSIHAWHLAQIKLKWYQRMGGRSKNFSRLGITRNTHAVSKRQKILIKKVNCKDCQYCVLIFYSVLICEATMFIRKYVGWYAALFFGIKTFTRFTYQWNIPVCNRLYNF